MNISTKQFYTLLGLTRQVHKKRDIIAGASHGRTDSWRSLTAREQRAVIQFLQRQANGASGKNRYQESNKMRRKIISFAHEMGWVTRTDGQIKADMDRLNRWCEKYGYLHKPLNSYRYEELPKLVTQFEAVRNQFIEQLSKPK